jgi:formamidopyrimidine-DNA glycosylase
MSGSLTITEHGTTPDTTGITGDSTRQPLKAPRPRGGAPAQAGASPERRTSLASLYHPQQTFHKHDHLILQTGNATITFNDPRRFGLVLLIPTHEVEEHNLFKHLGPEPLSDAFTATALRQKLHGKKMALKVAIMDQRTVVGVGNIYASEALFRAKLNPKLPAGKLTLKQAEILVSSIKQVLAEAIEAGGSSLRDFKHGNGQLGYFQHTFRVYDRKGEPCPVCGTPIQHATLGQRSTYWCPTCQKM